MDIIERIAQQTDIPVLNHPESERWGNAGIALTMVGLLASSAYCFVPRTIEGPITVTGKGEYYLIDGETGYQELQNTITIDKYNKCLRDIMPFGQDLEEGDTLSQVRWRPGLMGPCDYVVSYE